MIGAQNSVTVAGAAESVAAIFVQPPRLIGTGQIGSDLIVDFTFAEGADPLSTAYQWYSADTVLQGEDGDRLLVTAAMDTTLLKCVVTADISGSLQSTETEPVRALYQAPSGPPDLLPEVLDANSGIQQIDIASMVSGDALVFSVIGAVGVTIDTSTGVMSIDTVQPEGDLDLMVSAANSGGIWQADLTVTLEEQPAPDQVLDLTASTTRLYNDAHGLPAGAIDTAGIWISGFVFYAGSGEQDPIIAGLADPNAGSQYLELRPSYTALRRGGGEDRLNAFSVLDTAGWYLVTVRLWAAGNGNTQYAMMRNDLVSAVEGFGNTIYLTNWSRLGWSSLPDSTPKYGSAITTGLAWGTGDPTAYHNAVYGGGTFTDPAAYDFAADSGVTLIGYEAGARIGGGDTIFDLSDLEENWSSNGALAWLDLPPPYAGGAFGHLSSLDIGSSAQSDTFEVVVDLPAGDWGTTDVDMSKVALVATRGYGSLSVTGASVATSGSTATVTFDLSRRIYDDEVVEVTLQEAWITDDAGNRGSGTVDAVVNNVSALSVPASVLGLSYGRVAFDFANAYEAGITADGVMWVRDPGAGVEIAAKSPAQSTNANSRIIHGTMLNPVPRGDNLQGYTGVGSEAVARFDPALAVSFPVMVNAGDSLIGTVTNPSPSGANGGRSGNPVNVLQYQGLIVTNFTPSASDVAPPLVGYDAATRPPWVAVDISAAVAALPAGYNTTGIAMPDPDIVINRIERFNPALLQFDQVEMKREMTPSGFTDADGYGADVMATMSGVLLTLLDDSTTAQARERIVRWIVHHYRQWYGVGSLTRDGGHNQGALGFLVLGDHWVNGGAGIPTMLADIGGNESSAFEIIDQATLDRITLPHDGTTGWPRFSRRSTVSSVNGNTITVARIDALSGSSRRDATRELANLILVRESDSAEATVVGYDDNTGVLTLDSAAGLSVSDQIYFRAPWTQSIGDYEWSQRGLSAYSPSNNAVYRRLNTWSSEVMAIRALGLMHPTFAAIQGYVEMANAAGIPTPANDFPDHHVTFNYGDEEPASGAFQLDRDFWNAHWQTIKEVVQVF